MVLTTEATARQPVADRRGSERVSTKNYDLLAGDTAIGRGDKTDPEIPVVTRSPANPLTSASMPAASRREAKTASRPAGSPQAAPAVETAPNREHARPAARQKSGAVAPDYEKLATAEEQREFRDFGKRYRELEKKLVAIEGSALERKPGFISAVTGVFSAIREWHVKNQMAHVRKEERKLLDLVYDRAERTETRVIRINKDTPTILQRASVPVERQGHMPRYLALVTALDAEVSKRATAEKPLAIAHRDQVFVISRKNEAGQTESMMFSYREDGKVSYYKKSGADTEWKREATIWNDGAFSIGVAFMKGKPFPKVIKPSEEQRRVISPVKFDENWKPAQEPRMRL